MLPEIWGKYGWDFIHLVTVDYPLNPTDNDKQHYYQFFQNLQYILPCEKCRKQLSQHLINHPLTTSALASRDTLVKWTIDLHNIVNRSIGKPVLSYTDAFRAISQLVNTRTKRKSYTWCYLLALIICICIVCIVCWLILRRSKN